MRPRKHRTKSVVDVGDLRRTIASFLNVFCRVRAQTSMYFETAINVNSSSFRKNYIVLGKREALRHETFGIDVGLLYPSSACFLGNLESWM